MKDFEGIIRELDLIMRQQLAWHQQLRELGRYGFDATLEDEFQADLRQNMARNRLRLLRLLQRTVDFPPRHMRHFGTLERFWAEGSYDKSVFVMSKFPNGAAVADQELAHVLDVVSDAIEKAGYIPRIARGPARYHDALWDNVELHLLGCRQGVAIVEDRYLDELNPNVTMEWGWMRGMGKPVLFLVEENFTNARADVGGLIEDSFSWTDPSSTVHDSIRSWLTSLDDDPGAF